VTRGLYRSQWFEYLNALQEDDESAATQSLTRMRRAAQAVGVRYLSDFSRTAVYEGRRAEKLGKPARAARAYDAAVLLDETSFDAIWSKLEFLARRGQLGRAIALVPDALSALVQTRESRFTLLSSLVLWLLFAAALVWIGTVLVLLFRHGPLLAHDVGERVRPRLGDGASVPVFLLLLALPLIAGLGPIWIALWCSVLLFPYTARRERAVLAAGLLLLAATPAALAALSRENIIRRSPLFVAAVDLEEQREDGSAQDGLRQASAVFSEDADVWFLLGMYAQRGGDTQRAIGFYDRALTADPLDYRALVNRGNVHFEEGDYAQAMRDYLSAARRNPSAAEAYYNLSVARGESYDFVGQEEAIAQARLISEPKVDSWASRIALSRVVPASYPVSLARRRTEAWNAQPKSRRLPGHLPPGGPLLAGTRSPAAIGALVALALGAALALYRRRRGLASECLRCGSSFCAACKRYGDPPLYCTPCIRLEIRREDPTIDSHVALTQSIRERTSLRNRICRGLSLILPGAHSYFAGRPIRGAAALLAFFFAVAAVAIGWRFFDPRPLAPASRWSVTAATAALAAAALWISGNVAAWRTSHGP